MKNYLNPTTLNRSYVFASFILLFILTLCLPHKGYMYDTYCWAVWSSYSSANGLHNIYYSDTDYLPLYHYILYFFGKIVGYESVGQYVYYLKSITLIFHFITGFFVLQLIKNLYTPGKALLYTILFFLLNVAIVYNAFFWGQVDDIFTCFVFISFYFAYKKRVLISLLSLVIAINFKLQAIIFIPFLGLMLLPLMLKPFKPLKWVLWIASMAVLQILILLPFIYSNTVERMWEVVVNSFGKYPVVSINAFNFWDFIFWRSPIEVFDGTKFLGVTYKQWGLLLFFISSGIALFPLIKNTLLQIFNKTKTYVEIDKLLIIGALIPLLFFFFNTQMHERYSHPALAFIMIYSIREKEYLIPILISIAYLISLIMAQHFEHFMNDLSFKIIRKIPAILYLIGITLLYFRLYEVSKNNQNLST